MDAQIRQLSAANFDEAMEVLNLAFFADGSKDFKQWIPKLYRPTDELMSCHYAAMCEGRIRAVVGVFPLALNIDDTQLRIAGIGGVCTHPDYQERGLMRELMPHCINAARSEGYHLSWLGGQRQRYGYFGYEVCGTAIQFTLSRSNLRHTAGATATPGFDFEVIEESDCDRLGQVFELHNAQTMHAQRSESDLYPLLTSWNSRLYAALAGDDMVGYVVIGEQSMLCELVGEDADTELAIARAWVEGDGDLAQITLRMGPLDSALQRFADISENTTLTRSGNWQVFDWERVVATLLKTRLAHSPIMEGVVSVSIEGYGVLEIEVNDNEADCHLVSGTAAIECDSLLAHRLLFGPLKPSEVIELPAAARLLDAWCPLPLYWPPQDRV